MSKTYVFEIDHPGEWGAGIWPYDDVVSITVKSGNPGGEEGEFEEFMLACLQEWYWGANVTLKYTRGGK